MSSPAEPIPLVMLAGGGHAAEVYSYLGELPPGSVRLLGVLDDGKPPGPWEGSQILGRFDELERLLDTHERLQYLTCAGSNSFRRSLVAAAQRFGDRLTPYTLRHPSSQVGRRVEVGAGTLLAPGSIITTRARIGRHCILNAKVSVHHDCIVGDFVNLNPGATVAGNVVIEDEVFLGAGATVINGCRVGAGSVIGAGAVVVRDIPSGVTAVGVPARVVKRHEGTTRG